MNRGSRLRWSMAFGLATLSVLFGTSLTAGDANAVPTTTTTVDSSCPRVVTEGSVELPPAPTGVIAFDIYGASQGTTPFPQQILGNPLITGLDLAIGWDELEPDTPFADKGTPTPIEWSVLDCLFAQADHYGKFVVLTIIPGFDTPSWALYKVPTQSFSFQYGEPPYPAPAPLPLPWNPTYLNRWYAFLRAVAARYGTNPEFRMVAADGPTSVSGEMTLPYGTGDPAILHKVLSYGSTHFKIDGSDVAMWEALGYTPDLLERTWAKNFNEFAHIFRDKYISLALINGLPIGNVPKSTGPTLVRPSPPDSSQSTATPLTVIAEGRRHSPQFVLQENGLDAPAHQVADPGAVFNFVKANCASVPTGYQTRNPDDDGSIQDVLDKGVASGVGFLEIYVTQLLSASQSDLAAVATKWTKNVNCHPLRLVAIHTNSSDLSPVSVRATTTLDLATGDVINIFEDGRHLTSCHSSTCLITVALMSRGSTFSADVSYVHQPPLITTSAKVLRF